MNDKTAEQKAQEAQEGLWSRLFNWLMPDFSFWGIIQGLFMAALVLPVLYYFVKDPESALHQGLKDNFPKFGLMIDGLLEKVTPLFEKMGLKVDGIFSDKEKEEMFEKLDYSDQADLLAKKGIPTPTLDALTGKRKEEVAKWLDAIKAANGNAIPKDIFNANTLSYFLHEKPELGLKLVQNLPASTGGKPSDLQTKLLGAVKELVGNDAKLTAILAKAESRRVLAEAMVKFGDGKLTSVEAAESMLKAPNAKDILRSLLAAQGGAPEATPPAQNPQVTSAHQPPAASNPQPDPTQDVLLATPEGRAALLLQVNADLKKATTDDQKRPLRFAAWRLSEDGNKVWNTFGATISTPKLAEVEALLKQNNSGALLTYLNANPQVQAPLKKIIDALPTDLRADPSLASLHTILAAAPVTSPPNATTRGDTRPPSSAPVSPVLAASAYLVSLPDRHPAKPETLKIAMQTTDGMTNYLLTADNRAALRANNGEALTALSLVAAQAPSLLGGDLSPVAAKFLASPQNVKAVLAFGDAASMNPINRTNGAGTQQAVAVLFSKIMDRPMPAGNAEDLAKSLEAFLSAKANRDALHHLIISIDARQLPKPAKDQFIAFRQNWIDKKDLENNKGVYHMLSRPEWQHHFAYLLATGKEPESDMTTSASKWWDQKFTYSTEIAVLQQIFGASSANAPTASASPKLTYKHSSGGDPAAPWTPVVIEREAARAK